MVGPFFLLVAFHVDLFFSSDLFPSKNGMPKRLGPFDVQNSKYTKIGFPVLQNKEYPLENTQTIM
jgi:hypothetical protein